ncbi:integrin beta-1 [Octopus bimaculoides]|nr:integrin beta-1 [Octopus bimaculoides]
MQPQKIHLRIRPHQTVEIPFKFYQTKDSAVDMFFLIDISKTMEKYIAELANVSIHLVESLRNMTGSFRVGAGVFVEKPILPFVFASGKDISKKIDTYRLVTRLTQEAKVFKRTIKDLHSLMTNNADIPEAGLEAMMQAVVCEENVGWRNESRKIIIYCSDAPFHYAGDGLLAGAVIPNDGQCRMRGTKPSIYQGAEIQDYPSIQQIANALSLKQVTTIFAVASKEYIHLYEKLSRKIESSYVSDFNSETSTIADIITDSYKNISSSVTMAVLNKGINITFLVKCDGKKWTETKTCDGIKHSSVIEFKAVLTAGDCSQKQNQTITINPSGVKGKLEIQVEYICDCDCDKIFNSSQCNDRGTEKCGDCICNAGFTGSVCECTEEERLNAGNSTEKCKMDKNSEICSNRGKCTCGKCLCNGKSSNQMNFYRGKFCECDDFSCPLFNRRLCGGPSRGSCVCGKCVCTSNYTGDDCSCPITNDSCLGENNAICNNRGNCSCGVCTCDSTSGYTGLTCENPSICLNKCPVNLDCMLCAKSKNVSMCYTECKDMQFEEVDSLDKVTGELCKLMNKLCVIEYKCVNENGKEFLKIRKKDKCTKKRDKRMLIGGIIGGILAVGVLLLLLWKCVSMSLDHREMERFKKERTSAVWNTVSILFKIHFTVVVT